MSGKAKLSLEQIKAFNIAAVKFETQEGEKSLEDVDKIVNALSQRFEIHRLLIYLIFYSTVDNSYKF